MADHVADPIVGRAAEVELENSPALPVRAETPAPAPAPRTTVVRDTAPATSKAPDISIFSMSDECADLFAALAAAQGEFGEVDRTLEAKISSQRTGGTYAYQYESLADVLAAVRPALSKQGLAIVQLPFTRAASIVLRTMIVYGKAGGRAQWFYNELISSIADTSPQSIGSGITFLRRYALKSILGLAAGYDDDDGAAASRGPIEAAPRTRRPDPPMPAPIPARDRASSSTPELGTAPASTDRPAPTERAASVVIGTVAEVREVNGGALIRLSSGFTAGSRNAEIIAAARRLTEGPTVTVELITRPASDPGKAPTVIEIRPMGRSEASS